MADHPFRTAAAGLIADGCPDTYIAQQVGCSESYVASLRQVLDRTPAPARDTGVRATPALVEVRLIDPHPDNPRRDVGDVTELADSIRAQGLLQPLLLMPAGDRYLVVAGHRRLAAARRLGLESLPAVVRRGLERPDAIAAMLTENLQRADLNPVEEARAYRVLVDAGWTQTDVARATGRSVATVSHRLALLVLTPEEQDLVARGEIRKSHAIAEAVSRTTPTRGRGKTKPKPFTVPHLTFKHPLGSDVRRRCDSAGHTIMSRLGPGCGQCWESAIREDEREVARRGDER